MSLAQPHLFPGRLHITNKRAQHWGWHGLIAYGAHSYVVVVEPHSLRIVQTLDEHQACVCSVKWAPKGLLFNVSSDTPNRVHPEKLILATGDSEGNVLLWNILDASIIRTLTESNGSIKNMEWIEDDPQCLAVLYSNGILLLWDVIENKVLWKKNFGVDDLAHFEMNPFNPNHAAFASSTGWIYFTSGIIKNAPPEMLMKFRITPPDNQQKSGNSTQQNTSAIKQIIYSPAERDIIFLVLHKEIIIFDLKVNLTVGSINTDRGRSPFSQLQLRKNNARLFFCLHENGAISAWQAKHVKHPFKFELASMWELQRFTKQNKKTSISIYAILEGTHSHPELTMVANDGTLWLWKYREKNEKSSFCITGLMETISSPVTSLGVRSFTQGDEFVTSSITAIGTFSGTLQVMNMKNNEIECEFSISKQPLRCVRWLNQHTIIAFSIEELAGGDSGCWNNNLFVVDIRNGRITKIRDDKGVEVTCIRNIKVSCSRRYFVVLLKDRPMELWDAQTLSFIRNISIQSDQISTFCWSPKVRKVPVLSERFVVSPAPGQFHHFSVQNATVSKLFSHHEPELATITSIAWKGNYVVSGDSNGNLCIWDYETRKSKLISTNSKRVRNIRFAPAKNLYQILILFKSGDFSIFDIEQMTRLSNSSYLRSRDIKATEGGWIDESHPVVATSDGCIRVLDRSFATCNSAYNAEYQEELKHITYPLYNPYLLPGKLQLLLRICLQHGNFELLDRFPSTRKDIEEQQLNIPIQHLKAIKNANDIPTRCLRVSEYYSDDFEIQFWTLVLHAFHKINEKSNNSTLLTQDLLSFSEDSNIIPSNQDESKTEDSIQSYPDISSISESSENQIDIIDSPKIEEKTIENLTTNYDILRTKEEIFDEELDKAIRHRKDRPTGEHTIQNIDSFIKLNKKNEAIELLLETSPQDQKFLQDSLFACVIAAATSKDAFKSVVQSAANNLIAQNQVNVGIQLLLLIDCGIKACTHLQNRGNWDEAAKIAKSCLNDEDIASVYTRWGNYLVKQKKYKLAIKIFLTLRKFHEVLQILREWGQYQTAMMFHKALEEQELLDLDIQSSCLDSISFISPTLLKEAIYMDYGIYLVEIGAKTKSEEYASVKDIINILDKDGCTRLLQQSA